MKSAGKDSEAAQLTKGRRDSWDDDAGDCPVCVTAFDDTIQRPRTLPCGHTFCTPCINGLKEQGYVTCPTCRVAHVVPESGRFPISYAFEALIRRLRGAASTSPPPKPGKDTVTGTGQKSPVGFSRAIRSMLQEQEAKVLTAIRTCQEVQEQLDQYQTTLADWCERQQNLEDRLQALMDQSKGARVLVRKEESQVAAKKNQVHQGEQQLHALLQILRTVTTGLEAYKAIDDADHRTDEERQRAEECHEMFPDVHTVTTISKVREASSAAMEAATTVQAAWETMGAFAGAAGNPGLPEHSDSSITKRLKAVLTPTLKADDLRNLTYPLRKLLQAGLVFAISQQESRSRHAKISLEDGRLYLHSLQDQPLPIRAVTMQMDEVVPAAPPCLVFLDLAWPGSAPRRVLIRLSPNTPQGRQFMLLCTGQRGPCYANTRLWNVSGKGQPWERVLGGDYEYDDGTGGAAILPDLDKGEYRESGRAGDVSGLKGGPALGTLFAINTRTCQRGGVYGVFGEVVDGLDVVVAAAQQNPITKVTVVDCGVVLWS